MYRNSRTLRLDDDHYPELSDWLKKKYREKQLVGDADMKDDKPETEQEEY